MESLNKYEQNQYYKLDPIYHVGAKSLQYHTSYEMRELRKKLDEAMVVKGPGFVLTDSVVITWGKEIKAAKAHPVLRFVHQFVRAFTAPNSDAWRRWVLYRTLKEA